MPYDNIEDAINSIHQAKSWMALEIKSNFSHYFKRRLLNPLNLSPKASKGGRISAYADNSHSLFALYTLDSLLTSFESFAKNVGGKLGLNPTSFGAPIELKEPIYGEFKLQFSELITAALTMSFTHLMTMFIGSITVVLEQKMNRLERTFVVGIKPTEILIAHILFYLIPIVAVVGASVISFKFFEIIFIGSAIDVFLLMTIQTIQGLIIGTAISVVCSTELAAMVLLQTQA